MAQDNQSLTKADKIRIGFTVGTWVLGIIGGLWLDDRLDKITVLMETTRDVVVEVRTVVEMGPEALIEAGEGLSTGAEVFGEGVGEGAATAIDRAGDAWSRFRANDEGIQKDPIK
jgi:hypothetical protein